MKTSFNRGFVAALLSSCALTAMSAAAFAQPTQEAQGALEEIVVTGTRIVRDGYTAPTPVTVATTEELIKSTPTALPVGSRVMFTERTSRGCLGSFSRLGWIILAPKVDLNFTSVMDSLETSPTQESTSRRDIKHRRTELRGFN